LYAHQQSILESTIQGITYLGFLSIITSVGTSYVLSGKELDMADLNMNTWKTGWTEHIDFRRWRVNNSVLGWKIIS